MDHALYRKRRRRSVVALTLSALATLFGLAWLVWILGTLLLNGFAGLSLAVFTEMTPPPGATGGLLNAIMGSLVITVDVHVGRLRKALIVGNEADPVRTVRGSGYALDEQLVKRT
jgi:ABC-type phosphate transport system permease subunit